MPKIELKPLPFEEAIEDFKGLVPLTADEFYALAAEARALAFTVTGVMRMDVLTDMHGAVEKAISEGETLADFRNRLDEIFETRGWTPPPEMTPWRMETIFRNNVQTAYSAGRYKQMVGEKEAFPYWEYDAVDDAGTTDLCNSLDGKIYRADDPFWDTYYPPNHHQ
jgi:SPP1 gp7 family putative phage head morphogenesis protein